MDQMARDNTRFLELQNKARLSYRRLLKLNGKLSAHGLAFFYLTTTQQATNGLLFKPMQQIRS